MQFNRLPDFFTVDALERQADSFQYYIGFQSFPLNFESLVRGEEIHVAGDIRVRAPIGDGGPGSGGWGPIFGPMSLS